jgi:hypothetical protein
MQLLLKVTNLPYQVFLFDQILNWCKAFALMAPAIGATDICGCAIRELIFVSTPQNGGVAPKIAFITVDPIYRQ